MDRAWREKLTKKLYQTIRTVESEEARRYLKEVVKEVLQDSVGEPISLSWRIRSMANLLNYMTPRIKHVRPLKDVVDLLKSLLDDTLLLLDEIARIEIDDRHLFWTCMKIIEEYGVLGETIVFRAACNATDYPRKQLKKGGLPVINSCLERMVSGLPFDRALNLLQKYGKVSRLDIPHFLIATVITVISDLAYFRPDRKVVEEAIHLIEKYDYMDACSFAYGLSSYLHESKGRFIEDVLISLKNVAKEDPFTALLLSHNLSRLYALFGDKFRGVLKYFEKRRKRRYIQELDAVEPYHESEISRDIERIRPKGFGNKQIRKLIKFAIYDDVVRKLCPLDFVESGDMGLELPSDDLDECLRYLRKKLDEYMDALGIDLQKGWKFLPWLKAGSKTALKVLQGKCVEKVGPTRTFPLRARGDLKSVAGELEGYARQMGMEIELRDYDLPSLKEVARKIYLALDRKELSEGDRQEMRINLERIMKMESATKGCFITINPPMEEQLLALQLISSCLSPGGGYFDYTESYLQNEYTSFAVVKDRRGRIVGRVTIFRGVDEDGNPVISRVSRVYSIVPLSGREIDKALKEYARENSLRWLEEGVIRIPGLEGAYDDFVEGEEGRIVIRKADRD